MVGVQGLGGIPEPKPDRPERMRAGSGREAPPREQVQDDVVISSEAQAAARIAQVLQETETLNEVRTEKVEAARQRIEQGDYRKPEVVAQVAERISKYLP